MNTQASIKED